MGQLIVGNGLAIAWVIFAFICSSAPDANAIKCKAFTTTPGKAATAGRTPCLKGCVEENTECVSRETVCLFQNGGSPEYRGCGHEPVNCTSFSSTTGLCWCNKDFCNSDFTTCCNNQPGGPGGPGSAAGTLPCLTTVTSLVAITLGVGVSTAWSPSV